MIYAMPYHMARLNSSPNPNTGRSRRRPRQQVFVWKTRGGARRGAGRKAKPENVGLLAHRARPAFSRHVPVHVTMRAGRGVPNMRTQLVVNVVRAEIKRASVKGFRVLQFSVQHDHLHLLAEADDGTALARGMQRLASRVAMAINALTSRNGRFWRERYHRRDLPTPRQYRNALVYVTMNFRKHASASERVVRARLLDGCSSALWFDDWKDDGLDERFRDVLLDHRARAGPKPTVDPTTWIARVGWKKHGRLDPRESPRSPS